MPRTTGEQPERLKLGLLLTLALLAATGPISTDLFLAGLPGMAVDLEVPASVVQLTLTAFFLGLGLGQLVFGPVSDRFGRLRPLLIGSITCVVASVVVASAPTIELMVAGRFVQALGASAGLVIGRAIITDLLHGRALVQTMNVMFTISAISPVAAPLLGSAIIEGWGWRASLWVISIATVLMVVGVLLTVRESHPPERRTERVDLSAVPRLLTVLPFTGYAVQLVFCFCALMGYIAASPFIYQNVIGLTELQFGLVFAANAVGLGVGGYLSNRWAKAGRDPARVVAIALPLFAAACLATLAFVLLGVPPIALVFSIFASIGCFGFIAGNTIGIALDGVRHAAGAASAIIGAGQFLAGSVMSPVVGIAGDSSVLPLAIVMATGSVGGLTAFALTRAWVRRAAA